MMKLVTFVFFIGLMQATAAGYAQKINLSEKNTSLKMVLLEIKKQSGYLFFYNAEDLNQRKISINVKNASIEEALKACLQDQPFSYQIVENTVVLTRKEKTLIDRLSDYFTTIEVSGRVTDEEGKPLSGATVSVLISDGTNDKKTGDFNLNIKGRTTAAVTDGNGEFHLKNVDEKAKILISYTGYKVYAAPAARDMGTIKMTLSGILQEVNVTVNTGYQSIARERSAGAIAKPDMDILKNRSGSMNVIQRLDGLIPGLTINNAPNKTGATILVRGLTSINGNKNPLFVVNGIAMDDISSLNPNDVEDITVLKDATAASIWGARAANGVVVIVTKKGKNSDKPRVDYDAFINFQGKPDLGYVPTLRGNDFIQAARDTFDPVLNPWATIARVQAAGLNPIAPHETILYNQYRGLITKDQADAQLNALAAQDNLQQIKDLWYRNSSIMNHSISLSGGGNKYSFYGSGNYTRTLDNTPGNQDNNYGLNLRQDFRFNDRISAYLITDLRNNVISSRQTTSPTANFLPYVNFKNVDGTNADMPWLYRTDDARLGYENKSLISLNYNPLDDLNYANTKSNLIYGRVTSGLSVKLVKGLRYEGVYGFTRGYTKQINLLDEKSYAVRNELVSFTVAPKTSGDLPTYYLPSTGGRKTTSNLDQRNWTIRNQFIYDNSWNNGKHQLTVLGGQEAQESFTNSNSSVIRGYNSQLLSFGSIDYGQLSKSTTLNNSAPGAGIVYYGAPVMPSGLSNSVLANDQYSEQEQTVRFTSYYANAGYTFDQKYTVNGSWRIDQSNLFGKDKSAQNKPVWSSGLSWAIWKEDFMKQISWMDRLVLRTTYGITGNSPDPGSAASVDVLGKLTSTFFSNPNGLAINTPGNKKLSWETTKVTNVGIDFAILKSRISGSVDLYNKNTENLIGAMPVNPFTGYAYITGNLGSMNNKGVELSLKTINIDHADFRWSTLFNFAYNKNKITKLNTLKSLNGVSSPLTSASDFMAQPYLEGYSAFSVFAYQYSGLDHMGDPLVKLKDGTVTKSPTGVKIEDLKYMGTYQPVWAGGFTNIFEYKGFSLALNAVYSLGNVMRRDVNSYYSGRTLVQSASSAVFTTGNVNAEFANRWKNPGDEAFTNIPAYIGASGTNLSRRNTNYYTLADINVLDASYIKLRDATLAYSFPKTVLSRLKLNGLTIRGQVSNIMLWKANHADIDPEFQNALGGSVAGGIRSLPVNQHTLTLGVHLTL
ncbi:SusC/RagA family TonB-linked outer membrane protein [Pedobacter nutrimenti]|uniref:SusC/RagA family TonB-linked outer membrane protein n=1 Tax=Pedobacter nutrimenti TaxID=1241337 RepID=UPI00292CB287|nr:SusC/RagA family TonB-linked outer membrane protein [Pedobacter nutrimenti]